MGYRFNPPLNWPAPPPGWVPAPGWQPSPEWPSPPPGWQLWIDDTAPAPSPALERPQHPAEMDRRPAAGQPGHGRPDHQRASRLGRGGLSNALARHKIWTGVGAFILLSVIVYAATPHPNASGPASTVATATASPKIAKPSPSVASTYLAPVSVRNRDSSKHDARKPSFPPRTLAAFRAFAATGDASQVHQIDTSTEGLPSCPNPNIFVTVSRALTGRTLEADLSAFFVQSGLIDNRCQAFVFAFHSKADYQANENNGYTAGRVALTTNGGSGPQYNLEVDAGNVYDFPPEFNFNF